MKNTLSPQIVKKKIQKVEFFHALPAVRPAALTTVVPKERRMNLCYLLFVATSTQDLSCGLKT